MQDGERVFAAGARTDAAEEWGPFLVVGCSGSLYEPHLRHFPVKAALPEVCTREPH